MPPLVLQYDEFDNAALTMITHSPTAWDHVHFKDVLVKVSNVEVYYKAISFYLAEHPDLLTDMLKVREGLGILDFRLLRKSSTFLPQTSMVLLLTPLSCCVSYQRLIAL